ncbi:ABC transporter permease [Luteimicrobium album]|uniref:ABC transporter permease n=1 Tax=Luteimicrobium album TaxID=1054550 RepID=A0ABQ6I2Y0_9MICO|nr:ABC transporter permease [Luteimicrobium album]GMA24817.1 ABC transporter permease [Luteimicrobium album]
MTTIEVQPRTADEEFAERRRHIGQKIQHFVHRHPWSSPLAILIVTVMCFSAISAQFSAAVNLSLVLQQSAVLAAVSAGQVLVLISGGVDLSVGSLMVLTTLVVGKLSADAGLPDVIALLAGAAAGAALGAFNGSMIARFKLNPFIVTLGSLSIFGALVTLVSGGESIDAGKFGSLINLTGKSFKIAGFTFTWGIVVVAVLYLVLSYMLLQTSWGRHVFAVGDDSEAARLVAIRVSRVRMSVYIAAGVIMAIAGWVLIGRTAAASPQAATTVNLDSITAVVIGGTSLAGGRGSIIGAVVGSVLVTVFRNGLFLVGVDALYQNLAVGVLTIVAVGLDQWIRKVKA